MYGIVGEMNILICEIVKVKLFAAGSDIPFLVPKTFNDAVDAGQEHIVSDVEFAIIVKEGSVDVGLDDIGERVTVWVPLSCHTLLDFAKRR